MQFVTDKKIFCTAGVSYVLMYPNADVYRCMADYNSKCPPLFNAKKTMWIKECHNRECYHERCYAGCDIDWASKFIKKNEYDNPLYPARIGAFDSILGNIWTQQNIKSGENNFICIIWAPTLLCNYNCYYCGCSNKKSTTMKNFSSATPQCSVEDWIKIWEEILAAYDYGTVQITGGEPFLSPALGPIINRIAKKFSLCITSNLSLGHEKILRTLCEPSRIRQTPLGMLPVGLRRITASMHPTATLYDESSFLTTVKKVHNAGYLVDIHFVAHPKQLHLAEKMLNWAEENNIGFVLSPWTGRDRSGALASYTSSELKIIDKFISRNRTRAIEEKFINIDYKIILDSHHKAVSPNSIYEISGTLTNLSNCTWVSINDVRVGVRLYFKENFEAIREFRSQQKIQHVAPGEKFSFNITFDLRNIEPGSYKFVLDVVSEGNFWLADKGVTPYSEEILIGG